MKIQNFGKPLSRLITMVAICMLSLHAMAYDFSYTHQGTTLYYTITSDNTVEVSSSSSVSGAVVIPSSVTNNGTTYSVTSIGYEAFRNCRGLTSVTIPNSVTSIGQSAFASCSGLTSVTIPNSVTSIGNYAFYSCSSLTSVTIPNGVTSIGESAFSYCSGLTSVTLPNNATIHSRAFIRAGEKPTIDSVIYCNDTLIVGNYTFIDTGFLTFYLNGNSYFPNNNAVVFDCDESKSGDLIIPSTISYNGTTYSVTSIGEGAFHGCSSLTSVTIPNSVTSIGDRAFFDCSGLTSVTIPNSVTSIGDRAFAWCSSLTSVTIPNSVISIGEEAFLDCSGLTSVTIPNSVTSIGESAFSSCSSLTSVTIPNSVTSIGEWAFVNCSSLTSVTLPNNATIPSGAFIRAGTKTTTIDSVIYCSDTLIVGNYTFIDTGFLTFYLNGNSYFPNNNARVFSCYQSKSGNLIIQSAISYNGTTYSVTSIGEMAFYYCRGLTSVTIPNSVTSIGWCAFRECSGLTSVTIPNSVISIGEGAFENCSSLTSVTLPNSVTFIGGYAFYGCSGLTSVSIPNSVISIGEGAFSGCSGLTSVSIPNSITSIAKGAFRGCSSLTSVTIPNSVTSIGIGDHAFEDCSSLTSIVSNAVVPPAIGNAVFPKPNSCNVTVPCGSLETYIASSWNNYFPSRIEEDCSSTLQEVESTREFVVYPNPARGFATMEFETLQERSLLRIADLGGRVIKTFDLSAGTESVRLDLRDLPSGVYTLMIGNTTKKLIVE